MYLGERAMFWTVNGSGSFTPMGFFEDRFDRRIGSVWFGLTLASGTI